MMKQESNKSKSKSKTKGKILIVDDKPNIYGLLILDIKMPKMDGFELYDKVKKIDKKAKVFFISAFDIDRAAISKKYSDLKIENFLPKPIQIAQLIKTVEEQL